MPGWTRWDQMQGCCVLDLFDNPENGKEIFQGVVDARVSRWVWSYCDLTSWVWVNYTGFATMMMVCTLLQLYVWCPLSWLVDHLPEEIGRALGILWDCLSEMKDNLSSSIGFVMELLGWHLMNSDTYLAFRQATGIQHFHCDFIQFQLMVCNSCHRVLCGAWRVH